MQTYSTIKLLPRIRNCSLSFSNQYTSSTLSFCRTCSHFGDLASVPIRIAYLRLWLIHCHTDVNYVLLQRVETYQKICMSDHSNSGRSLVDRSESHRELRRTRIRRVPAREEGARRNETAVATMASASSLRQVGPEFVHLCMK